MTDNFGEIELVRNRIDAYLQETEQGRSLCSITADNTGLAEGCGQCNTFTQSAVLDGNRKERGRLNLFPKIESTEECQRSEY